MPNPNENQNPWSMQESDFKGKAYRPNVAFLQINARLSELENRPDAGSSSSILFARETPRGLIDGVNTIFGISRRPIENSFWLELNGVVQYEDGVDITFSGSTIAYIVAPQTGDRHMARYAYYKDAQLAVPAGLGAGAGSGSGGSSGGGGGSGGGGTGGGGYDGASTVPLAILPIHLAFIMTPYGPLDYVPGDRVRILHDATHYMEGTVTDYFAWWLPTNNSQMGVNIDTVVGSGVFAQWTISRA